jgi:hypothetical protein
MSLTVIPYQPIAFDLEDNCTLPCGSYIQLIRKSDRTSFQFGLEPCPTAWTVLTNGDFAGGDDDWNVTGVWSFSGGVATSPTGTVGGIQQTIEQTTAGYYKLSFYCNVNNGYLNIYNGTGWYVYTQRSGYHEYYFDASATTSITFYFSTALGGDISNIQLVPINSEVRVDVTDLDGNVLDTVPTSMITFADGYFTVNIDGWDDLDVPVGCRRFTIYDPCECSQFGFVGDDFRTANQWRTIAGSASIGGGLIQFKTAGQTQLRSRALLCPDVAYEITYTLSGLQGLDDFQVRIGDTNGTVRTTDGTYTETLTTSFTGNIDVRFIVNHNGVVHTIELSDFSIEAVTPIVSHTSVDFKLVDTDCCSILVEACGSGDELGFGFNGTGFKPILRVEGTYRGSGYPMTKEGYEFSNGVKAVPYARTRKTKALTFSAAEYIQDFARLWCALSNIYIDGEIMASEDDEPPTVSYFDDVDEGIVTFTFSKQELVEKRSCSAIVNIGCEEDGYSLEITSTGGFVLPNFELADINGNTLKFN